VKEAAVAAEEEEVVVEAAEAARFLVDEGRAEYGRAR
jgi:hypothetical protein